VSVIALQKKCDEKGLGAGSGHRSVRCRQFGWGRLRLLLRAGFLEKREKGRTPSCFAECKETTGASVAHQPTHSSNLQARSQQVKPARSFLVILTMCGSAEKRTRKRYDFFRRRVIGVRTSRLPSFFQSMRVAFLILNRSRNSAGIVTCPFAFILVRRIVDSST
jgi:hypothetical protein